MSASAANLGSVACFVAISGAYFKVGLVLVLVVVVDIKGGTDL